MSFQIRRRVDILMLQTLARREDVAELTKRYGLVVVDERHHIPAALHLGQVVHTVGDTAAAGTWEALAAGTTAPPTPRLKVYPTGFQYSGAANPSQPGGSLPSTATFCPTPSATLRFLTTSCSHSTRAATFWC